MDSNSLLKLDNVTIKYKTTDGSLTAVSNVSFEINKGEYFGLVGESGCGKSTVAKAIIQSLDKNAVITSGDIWYKGKNITEMSNSELNKEIRWKEISWIPQGSMNSLDPLEKISDQALEIAHTHTNMSDAESLEEFKHMFDIVGLQEDRIFEYPHQFSGGMQQRVIIALSLFLKPTFLIADEPTTALDVIMQDQIFKYLEKIKEELDLSMMLISHDIGIILESCDKMGIMHAGQLCELGSVKQIFRHPTHPYTIALQKSFPDIRNLDKPLEPIKGHPPRVSTDINFCTFESRCPWMVKKCKKTAPKLEAVFNDDDKDHFVSCFCKDKVREDMANAK